MHEGQTRKGAFLVDDLDVDTVVDEETLLLFLEEILLPELGEAELLGDEDLLSTGELELGSSHGLKGLGNVMFLAADREEDVTNLDSGGFAEGLSESMAHTGLESIGSGTGKHLVDSEHVPRVLADFEMEMLLSGVDLHVLVAGNTSGLQSFA